MPVKNKISQNVNNFVQGMPNSKFSLYATLLTLSMALVFAFIWILEVSFIFWVMPLTSFCYEENVAINTFINNNTKGDIVYDIKSSAWLEEYAPCSLNSVLAYDNSTWGGEPGNFHIGPAAVRNRELDCPADD